ncbi:ABC transporter permease [Paenibacillus sp. JMULE4]|uniref:ABC transporter permease n=1 Tax=Paenibacillus sp. JMULE4 TaxID=2518342 RepID=UPI0015771545|nr:ABC transporter permease [Paenibacillus sp. JMULE4]
MFTFLFKANISFVFHLLTIRFAGWRRWLLAGLLFITGAVSYIVSGKTCLLPDPGVVPVLLSFLSAGTLSLFIHRRIRVKGAFFGDIEREHKEKMKIASLVLSQGIEKPPSTPRSRPLLFRRSGRLFHRRTPGTGVAEAALKAFVRSGPRMKLYVQFVVLVMYAVAIVPSWLKWLLWGVLAFLLASWLRISGQELLDSRYLRLFRWEAADLSDGMSRAVFTLLLPATLAMSVALACTAWPERLWLGVPLMLSAGTVLAYAVSRLMILGVRIGTSGPPKANHDSVRDG